MRPLRRPAGAVGCAMLALVLGAAIAGPWIRPVDPLRQMLTAGGIFQPPTGTNPFGTDNLGRDLLVRVLYGVRLSLALSMTAVGIGSALGVLIGATAGMARGWWDLIAMRSMDALLAFPVLVLAIAVSVALGRGPLGVIIAVASVNVPIFARLARAQALRIMSQPYMTAAEILGCGRVRRLFLHLLPNMANPLVVQASVSLSFAIVIEAGLSFLGLGIQAPRPALGLMIAEGRAYIGIAPHMILFPSLGIILTVIGFNLIGDALAQAADPRGRTA